MEEDTVFCELNTKRLAMGEAAKHEIASSIVWLHYGTTQRALLNLLLLHA